MKEQIIEVRGYTFKVVEATMRHGIERGLLIADGQQAVKDDPKMHRSLQVLRLYLYPDLIAVTEDCPITFEEFASMPDECYTPWSNAVYELNPHWQIKDPKKVAKDAEKKASSSGAD